VEASGDLCLVMDAITTENTITQVEIIDPVSTPALACRLFTLANFA
jgi:hypothetical protein